MTTPSSSAAPRRDPYAVLRPRRGRVVPIVAGVLAFVLFTLSAVFVPGQAEQKDDWALADRLLLFFLGTAILWFLLRFARIRATPTREGLEVRNLFLTHRLAWGQIVRLQFGGGSPWGYLDTWDAETVPIMAVQKADGEFGRREAARLAALIDFHSAREPDPVSPTTDDRTPDVETRPAADERDEDASHGDDGFR